VRWASISPDPAGHSWTEVVKPQSFAILPAVTDLGSGEREALALAVETPGTVLVIDDGLARRLADLLRLRFTGTVGVLLRSKREGLLQAIAPVLDRLEGAAVSTGRRHQSRGSAPGFCRHGIEGMLCVPRCGIKFSRNL
jgi:predicted nucleic acid-binding protein